jgi:hypothetical protein
MAIAQVATRGSYSVFGKLAKVRPAPEQMFVFLVGLNFSKFISDRSKNLAAMEVRFADLAQSLTV